MRILLAEPTTKDVSMLDNVELIFPNNHPRPSSTDFDHISEAIARRLQVLQYDPANDAIAICGSQNLVAAIISVASSRYGRVRLAMHSHRENIYRVGTVG